MSLPGIEAWAARVTEGAARVRARIEAAGGDPASIRLLGVSKGQPAEALAAAAASGLTDLGESYAQELLRKVDQLDGLDAADATTQSIRWHMIGRLQRNKVRQIAPFVHVWQSIDRLSLAAEVARHSPGAAVLLQVNVTGSDQQGGCRPEQLPSVVEGCRDLGLDVRGLMAIGPLGAADESRAAFRLVRELADRFELEERSMGMSGDLESAVAEGSTMVRVGTAVFGPRGGAAPVGK